MASSTPAAVCDNDPALCELTGGMLAAVACIVAFSGVWFVLWLFLLYRAKRNLLNLPYADYKVANLFLRLQVHSPQNLCSNILQAHPMWFQMMRW